MNTKYKILLFAFVSFLTVSSFSYLGLPTNIRITIINELGNNEEGATVTVYLTEEDYNNEENAVAGPDITDEKGRVTFKKLEPIPYFIHAEKGDKNNNGAGVKTDSLVAGKLNRLSIVIE